MLLMIDRYKVDNMNRDSWGRRCFMVHLRLLKPEPFQVIFDVDNIYISVTSDEVDILLH